MTDDRRDPEIVVFGVEDGVWAGTSKSHGSDEIRQGDDRDRQRYPMPAGLARLRDLVTIDAGRVAPRRIAIGAASLVVVAFVAGVLVGRHSAHPAAPDHAGRDIAFTQALGDPPPSFRVRFAVPDPTPEVSTGPRVSVAASAVYAMQLKSTPVNQAGQSQEVRDAGAVRGPWSVIVRRSDGSLGQHRVVISYPVPSVSTGRAVRIGRTVRQISVSGKISPTDPAVVTGHTDAAGGIVWPMNGKFARIRGDLGRSMLTTLAGRVSIRKGRPMVTELPAGFRAIVSEPYRAPVVTESRYTDSLRVDSGPIDGLIYSEVVLGGASFEEALYSQITVAGGAISGHPAVRSPVGGGSATLAWEVAPGVVAFVGYAGGLVPSAATPSLTELARGGHLLGHAQWTTTHPSTTRGENDFS